MKKTVKIITGVLAAGVIFGAGMVTTGASSDWKSEVINSANVSLGKAGYNKKEELLKGDIGGKMKEAMNPTLTKEEEVLERLLEEYYNLKLNNLANSPEAKAIEEQIKVIQGQVLTRYKKEIDQAFTTN